MFLDIKKVCYNFDVENYIRILMNLISENKNKSVPISLLSSLARKWKSISISLVSFDNKNLSHWTILHKAKMWWGGISRDKKTKALVVVLFLVCFFCLAIATAHAAPAPAAPEKTWFDKVGDAIISALLKLPELLIGAVCVVLQKVGGLIIIIAGTIFAVAVDPANISGSTGILNQVALKDVWVTVRDTLNMFFILVLLFSAFCTIFQVEKWNLKKVWLNILINALLVNFSWTIARIIMDISNVIMYYFINHMFSSTTGAVSGSSIAAKIAAISDISKVVNPEGFDIAKSVMMVIFIWLFAIMLLVVAALFVIRLVALAVLLMFSPIGFVGYIFPATREWADKWWKQLITYSFFGPIMIFGMAIAINVTVAIQNSTGSSFLKQASNNVDSGDVTWIASAAMCMIPIVILWETMSLVKTMGIAGADKVVGLAKGGALAVGALAATAPWRAAKASGLTGGVKKGFEDARKKGTLFGADNRYTQLLKNNKEEREASLAGRISGGKAGQENARKGYKEKEYNEKSKESSEQHNDKSGEEIGRKILASNFDDPKDETQNKKNAMGVGAMMHHLKSNPVAKESYEADVRTRILADAGHQNNMAGMSSDLEKNAYVNKEVSKHWEALNKKETQARELITKNKKPTEKITEPGPKLGPQMAPKNQSASAPASTKTPIGFGRS